MVELIPAGAQAGDERRGAETMSKYAAIAAAGLLLSACANLPDVTYQYYQPKSATTMSATQNLNCVKDPASSDKKTIYSRLDITTTIATPVTNYAADYGQGPVTIKVKNLDGTFSDTDANFTFLEDGRLASMNTTLTGQGETILKSAISLGTSIAGLLPLMGASGKFGAEKAKADAGEINATCHLLAGWPGADKLSLTFTRTIDFGAPSRDWLQAMDTWLETNRNLPEKQRALLPTPPTYTLNKVKDITDGTTVVSDPELYNCLTQAGPCKKPFPAKVALPAVRVTLGAIDMDKRVVTYDANPDCDDPASSTNDYLCLQDTASVRMDYDVRQSDGMWKPATSSNVAILPLEGSHYRFVLPKPEWFGAGKAALSLAPSGAVTNAEYSKTNGAAGVMNVGTAAFTAATPAATVPAPSQTNSNSQPDTGPNVPPPPNPQPQPEH